jgi:hypothetical protein
MSRITRLSIDASLDATARLNDRLQGVARALEQWTRLKQREVPSEMWGFPPVISLVTKLDWEVLLLGHAVASRGQQAGETAVGEIERRLAEVETTISALDNMLAGAAPQTHHYGYAI